MTSRSEIRKSRNSVAQEKLITSNSEAYFRIFLPTKLEDGIFACKFSFVGLAPPSMQIGYGLDSMQALIRSFAAIQNHLKANQLYPFDRAGNDVSAGFPNIVIETELSSAKEVRKVQEIASAIAIEHHRSSLIGDRNANRHKKLVISSHLVQKVTKRPQNRSPRELCSRRFLCCGKSAVANLLGPTKCGHHYECAIRLKGFGKLRIDAVQGATPLQAIVGALIILESRLSEFDTAIQWEFAPRGHLGIPAFVSGPTSGGKIRSELISQGVDKELARYFRSHQP